jgi:anti-sigma factor RsiW
VSGNPHVPGRCQDLVAQINDYLDGDLSPERMTALERHLADCVCCTGFAASLRRAVHACRDSGQSTLPPAVRRRARARIAEIVGTDDPKPRARKRGR